MLIASASDGNAEYAAAYAIDGAIVFKKNTFATAEGSIDHIGNMALVFALAARYGRDNGIEGLVVDVSGNGGGTLSIIYFLLRMLWNGYSDPSVLCTDAQDFRKAEVWDYFVDNFSDGYITPLKEDLAAIPDDLLINGTQPQDIINAYQALVFVYQTLYGVYVGNEDFADQLTQTVQECSACGWECGDCSVGDFRANVITMFEGLTSLRQANGQFGVDINPELSEFIVDPADLEFWEPRDAWYNPGKQYMRGGVTGEYTQKFIGADCAGVVIPSPEMLFVSYLGIPMEEMSTYKFHNFNRIVLLSDGTCGSACSQFAKKLQVDGLVRTVSYGGYLGEAFDTSGFGGGSLMTWEAMVGSNDPVGVYQPLTSGGSPVMGHHRLFMPVIVCCMV